MDPISQDRDVLGKILAPYAAEDMEAREFRAASLFRGDPMGLTWS